MEHVTINEGTRITKDDKGIYINGELKILKKYLLYLIEYTDGLENIKEAERVYENNTALFLLVKYFGGK